MIDGPEPAIVQSFYRVPRFSGLILGIWPEDKRSWDKNLLYAFSFLVILIGACGENLYGFANLNNLVSALEAFCPGSTKAVCVLKLSIFFMYHRQWFGFVERLRGLLCATRSDEAQRMLVGLSTIANRLSLLLVSSGSITNTAFNVQPLIMGLYRWLRELPGQVELPFNIVLPDWATQSPLFPLSYLLLTASGACTVFAFSFIDGFFVCSCMYISGVFWIIQQDIRSIFVDLDKEEFFTPATNAAIRTRLVSIIDRHNTIIDLSTDLTRQFTVIVLMHFLSAAFVLCSTILDIMLNTSSFSGLTYICYTIAALTQLFLYCYGGNHVSESSLAVADTLYDVAWYKCDARTRKMILMILRRSQRAKTIAVPFFTPSLPAFSSILSTTGSYITLLNTFL